ncbi:DUF3817 domain-containing protein [Crocinitomix catalasitica]|uniref:DUF3817 domain-containing protein n=1 Tax=Crocinitomix catalasitica TaxID=184607 RepID=UPI0004811803|nr:DUF3817 domain-containing protein [Crocinitomix catalasitica]
MNSLKLLRLTGLLEGLSYLILLLIAMPLKYYWDQPEMVSQIGMAHGALFVLYILLVVLVGLKYNWSYKTIGWGLLASIIPLGTFIADAKIFKVADSAALKS